MGTRYRARHSRRSRRDSRVALITSALAVLLVAASAIAGAFLLAPVARSLSEPTRTAPSALAENRPSAPPPTAIHEEPGPETEAPAEPAPPAAPDAPVSPAAQSCDGPSLMSVWAHQDDDLIFANPELAAAIANGECVRTLYLTAGDAGRGEAYSRSRELGILRSYNMMRGEKAYWDQRDITLLSGAELTVFTPQGDPRISVAFLRLPDGGMKGDGFPATGNAGIPKLLSGALAALAPIDGGPPVTSAGLQQTIAELITAWAPTRLFTHVPGAATALSQGDHPDHAATGDLVRQAWQSVGYPADAVRYYVGYPSQDLPANVSGDALSRKVDVYRTYAKEDKVIACDDNAACLARRGFGSWLQRSYAKTDAELGIG